MNLIYLIRHAETEWARSGRHTSFTDIPLTEKGEKQAALLGSRLKTYSFKSVFVSPLLRATQTCQLAGFGDVAQTEPLLVEWSYGKYEGWTRSAIEREIPDWNVFLYGAPGGETAQDVQARCFKMLQLMQKVQGDVALFSHGHFLRAFTAVYIQLSITEGRHFTLHPASLGILADENEAPAIRLWNDISHLC